MQLTTLKVSERNKGASRANNRLRKQGVVPAVYYGNSQEAVVLSVDAVELRSVLAPGKRYTLLDLEINGKAGNPAFIKEYQKDALTQEITHVDFMRVAKEDRINVKVPVRLKGNPVGVRNEGGMLKKEAKFLKLNVAADNIPAAIELDITSFKSNIVYYAKQLDLGDATLVSKPQTVLFTISKGRVATTAATDSKAKGKKGK